MDNQLNKVFYIKQRHEKKWMALKGVRSVGVGIVRGQEGIIVTVKSRAPDIKKHIPAEIDGVPIKVMVTGDNDFL